MNRPLNDRNVIKKLHLNYPVKVVHENSTFTVFYMGKFMRALMQKRRSSHGETSRLSALFTDHPVTVTVVHILIQPMVTRDRHLKSGIFSFFDCHLPVSVNVDIG